MTPTFDGESYQLWDVRMETYFEALDLWEAPEEHYEITHHGPDQDSLEKMTLKRT